MQHTESSQQIYFTTDYARFKMITGNRPLNAGKIKKILNDIGDGTNVLKYCPILCIEKDGRLDIIDGQHRFYVSRKIGSPVFYTISTSLSLYDIAKINSNTEKWKPSDYVNCYVQLENPHYKTLEGLLDDYPVPISTAISILISGKISGGGRNRDSFERGEFEVKKEDDTRALCESVSKFEFNKKFSRDFMRAIEKVKEGNKISLQELTEKVNANIEKLTPQSSYKDYLFNLENIYNIKKSIRSVIY